MFLYLLISLFPLFLIKSIFENYSLSWVISRKRDSVHLRVREIREERVDKMLPPDTKFREPRDSLKRKGLEIQREGFFPVSSCLEGPSPKLFISHRIFTNVNCFLPGFTNLQVMLQGITSIYWLLAATELQYPTQQFPWGSRGASHKLTCSLFGLFFPNSFLMCTLPMKLFAKNNKKQKNPPGWPKK